MAAAATMPPAGQSLTEQVTDTLLYPFHSAALLARRLQVYGAAYYIFNTYCSYEEQAEHLYGEALEKHWADAHTRLASVAVWHATSLLGLWVKLAQFMSSRTDVLPEPWIAALAQLQDSVPPRPYGEVATTLAEELGADFADLFESVSAAPLAAASIAQVHRATLRGGADVVLKVQHRGVRQVVLQDLENAAYLCEYVAAQKPEHDFRELLREWIDETKRELDFEREALNTDLVGDALRSAGCACTVPGVIRRGRVRPTARLLPLEFVDGVKPNDARALSRLEVDVDELLGDISEAFATNILIDGRFNADPHPGNILVRKSDGRPVLLDFGLTKVLPEPSRLGIARLVLAAAESDAAGVVAAVRALSLDQLAGRGGEGLDARHALDVAQFLFRDASVGGRRGGRAQRAAFDDRRRQRQRRSEAAAAAPRAPPPAPPPAPFFGFDFRPVAPQAASPRAQASEIDEGDDDADREDTESDDDDRGGGDAPEHVCGATGKLYASQATPGTILFVLRVVGCLRGIAVSLGASHSYLRAMRPAARLALATERHRRASLRPPPRAPGDPNASGSRVFDCLRELCASGAARGIQVCAYKYGRKVVSEWCGDRGPTDGRPVQEDTLFPIWSGGKGVTAALAYCCAADGAFAYDDAVASRWPLFASRGKERITFRELLEHRAGLAGATPPAFARALAALDGAALRRDASPAGWRGCQRWLAKHAAPDPAARGRYEYHAVSHGWLVGGALERLATARAEARREPFDALLARRLLRPLGVERHVAARLAPRKDGAGDALRAFERLALTCVPEDVVDAAGAALGEGGVVPDPRLINEPACASVLLPSTTMHATAAGLAAVYGALAHGGAVESARGPILDPYQVDDLHRDFEAARDAAGDGPASPLGFSRYGLERAGATRHAFGHAGLGQMFAFADPEDGLGVAVLVNQISPEPVAADAALACLLAELGAGRRIV